MRLAIAHPIGLGRLGLADVVRRLDGVEVAGEADNLDRLVELVDGQEPGLVIVDLDLPGLAGRDDVVAPLRDTASDLKVVVVSDRTTDTAVVRTFRSEAHGFVVTDRAHEMLPMAIVEVMCGGTFVDPEVAGILVALVWKGQRSYQGPFDLTFQEQRVAVLLTEEMTNRQIGEQLGISPGTVKTHVANAVAKLEAHDRHHAAQIVRREAIPSPAR